MGRGDPDARRARSRAGASSSRWSRVCCTSAAPIPGSASCWPSWRARRCSRIPSRRTAVNVRELRRDYDRFVRLPRKLVQDLARTTAVAQRAWSAAREAADFAPFPSPSREDRGAQAGGGRVRRVRARAVRRADRGLRARHHQRDRRPAVRRHAARAGAAGCADRGREPAAATSPCCGVRSRWRASASFGEAVAGAVGFDFERGRLDLGVHPCCTSLGPGDCRIGLRFDLRDFVGGVLTVLHEVGHGLYEQGLDPRSLRHRRWARRHRWGWTSRRRGYGRTGWGGAGDSGSTSCRWRASGFPRRWATWTWTSSTSRVNRVTPSLIRVHADEVTYNVHVMIRFELERALMSGDLAAADLPGAWNDAYRDYLGVTPSNDAEGCLQDGHWADGLFGYFPTYTLGDVFGAQLFAQARAGAGRAGGAVRAGGVRASWCAGWVSGSIGRAPDTRRRGSSRWSPARHRITGRWSRRCARGTERCTISES